MSYASNEQKERRKLTLKELHQAAYGERMYKNGDEWETKQSPDDDDADCVCD